jgi:hypothetical protein
MELVAAKREFVGKRPRRAMMGRTNEASRSWPSSRRRLPASTPIAHRCRPAPSGDDGDPLRKEAQSERGHERLACDPRRAVISSSGIEPDAALCLTDLHERHLLSPVRPAGVWSLTVIEPPALGSHKRPSGSRAHQEPTARTKWVHCSGIGRAARTPTPCTTGWFPVSRGSSGTLGDSRRDRSAR